jgi:hypothetical protein
MSIVAISFIVCTALVSVGVRRLHNDAFAVKQNIMQGNRQDNEMK